MSALRARLALWSAFATSALLLVVVDAMRAPRDQVSVRVFHRAVATYRAVARPFVSRFVVCRYRPSCSQYAEQAVAVHGIARGLALSVRRLASCTRAVRPGTFDPVPGVRPRPAGS
jgi:putative component of membrane protein insertase Oxa1/YidC/SpoIIIJ protein YidD